MDVGVVSSLGLMNKTAVYIFVQVFLGNMFLFLFGKYLGVKFLGHRVDRYMINLVKLTNTSIITFVPNLPQ